MTQPDDLIDLDPNQTPASDVDLNNQNQTEAKGFPMAAATVIGVGALVVLIALMLIVRKRLRA